MKSTETEWINDILNSVEGIERAAPNPFLLAKIQHRLMAKPSQTMVPARLVWLAAGAFVLLLMLNAQFIQQRLARPNQTDTQLSAVVSEMQLYPTQNQLYAR
jgi:hypothetical protein